MLTFVLIGSVHWTKLFSRRNWYPVPGTFLPWTILIVFLIVSSYLSYGPSAILTSMQDGALPL